jgi:hypothetical protein
MNKTYTTTDRLARMWEDLLANPVAPEPAAKERIPPELAPVWSLQGGEPEIPLIAPFAPAWEEGRLDPLPVNHGESNHRIPAAIVAAEPVRRPWRDALENFFDNLVELVNTKVPFSVGVTSSETEAAPATTLESAHQDSLSYSSPFRWEPKPSWLTAPVQSNPRTPTIPDIERLVFRPKIPLRPLHKQRFYRRFLFYLRGWLSRSFRKTA